MYFSINFLYIDKKVFGERWGFFFFGGGGGLFQWRELSLFP